MTLQVKIYRTHHDAQLPTYKSAGASGMDLCARLDHEFTLFPTLPGRISELHSTSGFAVFDTGVAIALPPGYEAQVRPRSGLSSKRIVAMFGTVDSDYRGSIGVVLANFGSEPFTIKPGDRIAQLVIAPVARAELVEVQTADELGETERGSAGFGSSGIGSSGV